VDLIGSTCTCLPGFMPTGRAVSYWLWSAASAAVAAAISSDLSRL